MLRAIKGRPSKLRGYKPVLTNKSSSFFYSSVSFFVYESDIFVRFTGRYVKTRWLIIENYKKHTVLEVIGDSELGSHFEDGIFKLWKRNKLPFGYVERVVRCKVGSSN